MSKATARHGAFWPNAARSATPSNAWTSLLFGCHGAETAPETRLAAAATRDLSAQFEYDVPTDHSYLANRSHMAIVGCAARSHTYHSKFDSFPFDYLTSCE